MSADQPMTSFRPQMPLLQLRVHCILTTKIGYQGGILNALESLRRSRSRFVAAAVSSLLTAFIFLPVFAFDQPQAGAAERAARQTSSALGTAHAAHGVPITIGY